MIYLPIDYNHSVSKHSIYILVLQFECFSIFYIEFNTEFCLRTLKLSTIGKDNPAPFKNTEIKKIISQNNSKTLW